MSRADGLQQSSSARVFPPFLCASPGTQDTSLFLSDWTFSLALPSTAPHADFPLQTFTIVPSPLALQLSASLEESSLPQNDTIAVIAEDLLLPALVSELVLGLTPDAVLSPRRYWQP